jgi:hypothetical protein
MRYVPALILSLFLVPAGFGFSFAVEQDVKGSKDHALLTRMPNFYIVEYKDTESDAAISEIVKLLMNNTALKLYIVGHTDNTGSFDSNMKLSQDRADAVVKVLTGKHGIQALRLNSYGVSSLVPVKSNDTEDGKAKNRRVELVKQ